MIRAAVVAIGALALFVPAGVAHADPAVPTDFATEVVGIEPATPTIHVGVVGGDSFVELTVERGTDVVVLGYWGEPYLRFNRDGSVEENQRSPTVAENASRFGGSSPASGSGAGAESEWAEVDTRRQLRLARPPSALDEHASRRPGPAATRCSPG